MILGHLILGICKVAVGTCPVVECDEAFHFLIIIRLVIALINDYSSFLFLFVLLDLLLERFIEFLDPALDAAQMERLMALLAIPDSTALIDRVLTDDTILRAFRE